MALRLDPTNPEPLFQQLVSAVKHAVAVGAMAPGDRLPSVRELARELVVNPNTVARAYQALETEGVTRSRRGSGTFIADRRVTLRDDERRRRFREGLDALLSDAVHLGLSEPDVRGEIDEAIGRFRFDGPTAEDEG